MIKNTALVILTSIFFSLTGSQQSVPEVRIDITSDCEKIDQKTASMKQTAQKENKLALMDSFACRDCNKYHTIIVTKENTSGPYIITVCDRWLIK